MNISSTQLQKQAFQPKLATQPATSKDHEVSIPDMASANQDSVTFGSDGGTPPMVKAGKYLLAAATTAGAGALAYYAGTNVGAAAAVAGVAGGALAGGTVLGTVGLISDIHSGIGGSPLNSALLFAGGGLVAGGIGGGLVGAAVQSGAAGIGMGVVAGLSGLALVSAATNIGAK